MALRSPIEIDLGQPLAPIRGKTGILPDAAVETYPRPPIPQIRGAPKAAR